MDDGVNYNQNQSFHFYLFIFRLVNRKAMDA